MEESTCKSLLCNNSYSSTWYYSWYDRLYKDLGLFGAANQLLAGIGLLAVAAWLANCGKNNKMFLIPMAFMIVVTICSLCLTIKNQIGIIVKGGADWGPWAQAIIGALLVVLAIFLVIEGWDTLFGKKKKAEAK